MKTFTLDINELHSNDINGVFKEFYQAFKPEIIIYFKELFPDKDFTTYEGGIDTWFGLGSVMLFELGIEAKLKFEYYNTHLILK